MSTIDMETGITTLEHFDVQDEVDSFNSRVWPAGHPGAWLTASVEFHRGGDFTLQFLDESGDSPVTVHEVYDDLDALDAFHSALDRADADEASDLLEGLRASYAAAEAAKWASRFNHPVYSSSPEQEAADRVYEGRNGYKGVAA